MLAAGFYSVGKDFPVFIHPKTKDEYALARKEIQTGPGHKDFKFIFGPEITLEEDLVRRDFTCNALAYDEETEEIIDLFGGFDDINNHILRHINDQHFPEDPLRVLRACRLAAQLNFNIAPQTNLIMQQMVAAGLLQYLSDERIWQEFAKALKLPNFATFIKTMHDCNALQYLLPATTLFDIDELITPLKKASTYSSKIKFAVFVNSFAVSACKILRIPTQFKEFALLCEIYGRSILNLSKDKPEELVDTINETSMHCRKYSLLEEVLSFCHCLTDDETFFKQQFELCRQTYIVMSTITAQALPNFTTLSGSEISKAMRDAQISALQNYFKS